MSTVPLSPTARKPAGELWSRLIPGEDPAVFGRRLRVSTPSQHGLHEVRSRPDASFENSSALQFVLPRPLQNRMAREWLQSVSVDFALVAINWLLIGAALVPLSVWFPHHRMLEFAEGAPFSLLGVAVLHAALITLVGYSEGIYSKAWSVRGQELLAKSVAWATLVLCCAYHLQGAPWSISILFCAAGVLHFTTLGLWRRAMHQARDRKVLIIGAREVATRMASYLEEHPLNGRTVYGFLDDEQPLGNGVVGRIGDLAQIARRGFVEEIILAAPRDPELTRWVFREACRLRLDVEVVPELFGCDPEVSEVEQVDGLPVICLHAERLPALSLVLKRVADFVGAGLALMALSPLLTAIALLIKVDSDGPVLYSAQRAGRKGRRFRCHKFRTMVSNADKLKDLLRQNNQRSGPFFKIRGDPRITRVGRFLRRYSLDELPQLLNVLAGEMSLVGPRPHPLDDVAEYELEHLARLDVTPGITGLWQVTARRDPSFERGMALDREYIRTWSLGLDLRILLKTVGAVLQGSGE